MIERNQDGKTFACKVVPLAGSPEKRYKQRKEAEILEKLEDHQFLVKIEDHYEYNGSLYIIMEYVNGRNFEELIDESTGHEWVDKVLLDLALKFARALVELHR